MEKINKIKKNGAGFSLVELIIAVGIFSILAVGVVMVTTNSYSNFQGTGDRQIVSKFAQEAIEATRAIRDNCWQDVEDAAGSATGITKNQDGIWQFGGESDTQGSLTRTVVVANVQRNEAGDIVESGGIDDPDTKKVTVTVSGSGIEDYTLTTFLTNWSNKEWCQKDWTAGTGTQFWQGNNSIFTADKIDFTTANQLKLTPASGGGGSEWADWEDATIDQYIRVGAAPIMPEVYSIDFSPDGNTMYYVQWLGPKGKAVLRVYDITNVRTTGMTFLWSLTITEFATAKYVIVHPNGNYAYLGVGTHGSTGSPKSIAIVNLNAHTYTLHNGQLASWLDPLLVMDDAGDYLYALDGYGKAYVYDISADGSSLTTVNTGQQMTYSTSYRFHDAWYDDTDDKIYAVVNGYTGYNDLMKIDVTNKASLTVDYGYIESGSGNFRNITYAGTNPINGHDTFIIISSLTDSEFKILEDTGSGFSLVDSLNPSLGSSFKGVIFDGDHTAMTLSSVGGIISVDITDLTDITEILALPGGVSSGPTYPLTKIFYNNAKGGVFYVWGWNDYDETYMDIAFIERPQGAGGGGGGYESTGYATSSIMDIGASDQQLSQVSIEQNVPSGCTLDIILQGSDTSNFASYESQTFTNAASAYTSVTNQNLNNKRFLRYVVYMAPCTVTTDNDTTATLYSFKLKYK